ncbi:MAG: DUF4440 domain-containing protein [Pseudomonadota bacterium]
MTSILSWIAVASATCVPGAQSPELARIDATNAAVRDAFAKGDVETIARYHHKDVTKSLGPGQYYAGREALKQQLKDAFANVSLDFGDRGEELRESLTVCGDTAISIARFEIAWTPKDGSPGGIARGRTMIVQVRSDRAPHGWVTLTEVIQPEN